MYAVFQSEARKVGMTRVFTESGDSIPVTVVEIDDRNWSNKHQRISTNKSDRKRDRKNRWR